MSLPFITILFYGFSAVIIIILGMVLAIEIRLARLLRGKNAKTLEDVIAGLGKEVKELRSFEHEAMDYLKNAEVRMSQSVQGIATVRFNPFKGTGSGGNQSFSTAFVNERGDGVVISSLYTRERVSTFAKPLANFVSEYELTAEEKESVVKARSNIKNTKQK